MKKIISLLALVMTFAMLATCVGAEIYDVSEILPAGDEILNVNGDQNNIAGYKGEIGTNLFNLAPGGSAFCCKMDTNVWYEFKAPVDGTITFVIDYIARDGGANRGLDWSLDDMDGTKRVFMDLEESADHRFVSDSFDVTAGTHTFHVYAPTGMDDSTLKSCDVYNVALYFEAAPETEAETVAPAEEAPVVEAAPQTFDVVTVAAVAAVVSLAGFAVSKKR